MSRSLLLVALLAAPLMASAADLTFSFAGYGDYDDNVFRRDENKDDDFLFRLVPAVELHEDRGQDIDYSLKYTIPLEFSTQNGDELNDVDHWGDVEIRYHPSARVEFFVEDEFRYLRSTLRTNQTFDSQGIPLISTERDRVTLNRARVGAAYLFSPRLQGGIEASHRLFDTTREDRQDSWTVSALGDLSYRLDERHRVGLGLQYLHQDFDESIIVVGSKTDSVNAFATWEWQIDETTGLTVTAGPTYISIEQDDPATVTGRLVPFSLDANGAVTSLLTGCDTVPAGPSAGDPFLGTDCTLGSFASTSAAFAWLTSPANSIVSLVPEGDVDTDDESVDVFADVALVKRWSPNLNTGVRYNRSQGMGSGLGGTVIRDTVTASVDWTMTERWRFLLRGDWANRESVSDANRIYRTVTDAGAFDASVAGVAALDGRSVVTKSGTNKIETERWGVTGRVTHRLLRRTDLIAQASYNDQSSTENTLGTRSDFTNWIATFGVRHVFEPLKLW